MTDMPKVSRCDTTDCVYNMDRMCHALAISVSGGENPDCETYASGQKKGGDRNAIAGVGACKAEACEYNRDLECHAPAIQVGARNGENDACLTFEARQPARA